MKQAFNVGDRVGLLDWAQCPGWKVQYIGQTATILDVAHNRVQLVRCNSNIHWPLEAVEKVK
jgi:hypothetical protein